MGTKQRGTDRATWEVLADLQKEVLRVGLRVPADSVSLKVVFQPDKHPFPGSFWHEERRGFWSAGWHGIGNYIGPMRIDGLDADKSDSLYPFCGIYLVTYNVAHATEFRTIAMPVGRLFDRINGQNKSTNGELSWCKWLFKRHVNDLHWERNEQPGHPETTSLFAVLNQVFDLTESGLAEILEERKGRQQQSGIGRQIDNKRPNEFASGPLIGTKTELGFAIRHPQLPVLTSEQGLRCHLETVASRPNSPLWLEDTGATKTAAYFRDAKQYHDAESRLKDAQAFIKTLPKGNSKKVRERRRKPTKVTSQRKSK